MSDISSKVVSIIVDKLNVEESEVTNEASFTNDLGENSLDTVELIWNSKKNSISIIRTIRLKAFKLLVMRFLILKINHNFHY